jgi:hypothetical protein
VNLPAQLLVNALFVIDVKVSTFQLADDESLRIVGRLGFEADKMCIARDFFA